MILNYTGRRIHHTDGQITLSSYLTCSGSPRAHRDPDVGLQTQAVLRCKAQPHALLYSQAFTPLKAQYLASGGTFGDFHRIPSSLVCRGKDWSFVWAKNQMCETTCGGNSMQWVWESRQTALGWMGKDSSGKQPSLHYSPWFEELLALSV